METRRQASTCRWAVPTLFFAPPLWFFAWDAPRTCLRKGMTLAPGASDPCLRCASWEPPAEAAGDMPKSVPQPDGHLDIT